MVHIYLTIIWTLYVSISATIDPWNLPVVPTDPSFFELDHKYNVTKPTDKKIPRITWVSFKVVPPRESMHAVNIELIDRALAENWKVNLMSKYDQEDFMARYYPNTSLLWAFNMIHEKAGAFASDIWRYSALYKFGGFYIDDDSHMKTSPEKIVGPNDTLILGEERNLYIEDNECFEPHYDLSLRYLRNTYNQSAHGSFDDRVLINWAMFSMPGHPFIKELLQNMVRTIRNEYLREPIFAKYKFHTNWKRCLCLTGPQMLTATIKKNYFLHTLNYGTEKNFSARGVWKDFEIYGGWYKAVGEGVRGRGHYMETLHGDVNCLKEYAPLKASHFEGQAVSGDGRVIYLVENGTLRVFPNYDTFLGMGFALKRVVNVEKKNFRMFPMGPELPSV